LWYAQFYQNGKKVRVTTGESVKQKAFTKLRILMGKADTGEKSPIELKNTRYAELREGLLNDYDAQERRSLYTTADGETVPGLKHLDAFVGFNKDNPGPSVTALTADYADVFIKRQKGLGFSSATINRSLHCLRRMLTLAHGRGKIDRVPKFTFLKEPPARQGFLTVPQFERLLKMLPTYLRPLVQFLYWCGCRKGEALLIEWPQVNLAERLIKLEGHQTKNGEATRNAGRFLTRPTSGWNGRRLARRSGTVRWKNARASPASSGINTAGLSFTIYAGQPFAILLRRATRKR